MTRTMPFTIRLVGVGDVEVIHDPDLDYRGICDWNIQYDWSMRPIIRLRQYDQRVLLHEVLHALIGTDQAMPTELRAGTDGHEQLVRRLTRGLIGMGWRLSEGTIDPEIHNAEVDRVAMAVRMCLAIHPDPHPGVACADKSGHGGPHTWARSSDVKPESDRRSTGAASLERPADAEHAALLLAAAMQEAGYRYDTDAAKSILGFLGATDQGGWDECPGWGLARLSEGTDR